MARHWYANTFSSTVQHEPTTVFAGASSGLGLALTKRILARGDRVIATARRPSKLTALFPTASPDQIHALYLYLDVTASFEDIKRIVDRAVEHWGRIDVLVNNAGLIDTIGPGEELGFVLTSMQNESWRLYLTNEIRELAISSRRTWPRTSSAS